MPNYLTKVCLQKATNGHTESRNNKGMAETAAVPLCKTGKGDAEDRWGWHLESQALQNVLVPKPEQSSVIYKLNTESRFEMKNNQTEPLADNTVYDTSYNWIEKQY